MGVQQEISPRGMVLRVLSMAGGEYLSVNEIISRVYEKFNYNMKPETVVRALDESDYCIGNIEERIERRGKLNLPVKVFSIKQQE